MTDLLKNIGSLTPERRKLLELLLKDKGVDVAQALILPQDRNSNQFPLSFAQQRLWFLDQLEPGRAVYNIPIAVRLSGQLDLSALQRSFDALIARHETLRTTFETTQSGEPVQVIHPPASLALPVIDLSHWQDAEREIKAVRLANQEAQRPFDLRHGPLLRVALVRLRENEHLALVNMHHIISDGWSVGIFISELATCYNAFHNEQSPVLPDLRVQYADFAAWQRQWLQGPRLDEQLAFWKTSLADGGSPPLELPTDRPRPPMQTFVGDRLTFALPRNLSDALDALARSEDATPFMALQAAFVALLHRYTGQDDISLGTPVAGRTRAETDPLIGFFVNTLVLRSDLSGEPSFRQLLRRTRQASLDAFAHQELPFERVVEAAQPPRDLSRPPLFQVLFTLQNLPPQHIEQPDLTFSPVDVALQTVKFDLTLSLAQSADGLSGVFGFNTDLFDLSTIEQLSRHLRILLDAIVAAPDQPIAHLPLLEPAERERVLYAWNDTDAAFPADRCLHQLFEDQAARTPDAVAVIQPAAQLDADDARALTYAELNARADQLAHHLRSLGVGPETRVGVSMEKSPDLIVALLGVLKAGGAYVPIDPAYPPDRIAFMLEDSGAKMVITDEGVEIRGQRSEDRDQRSEGGDQTGTRNSEPGTLPVAPDNLAYVIYTSGTTGQPKGVAVSHRSVVNYVSTAADLFELTPGDRWLQFFSISFDAAAEEIYPTLLRGATLVLRTDAMLGQAEHFFAQCRRWGITVLDLATAYWHQLVTDMAERDVTLPDTVRLVIIGGERALSADIHVWRQLAGPGVRLLNTYGPTEATIVATIWDGTAHEFTGETPIGRPAPNVRTYVLDVHMQPAPIGVAGELYIGGMGVARGYLNQPHLTARMFTPDPFHPAPGARLYRTGDKVRWLPDGQLQYLGRIDQQVKIRGFRIEPGEIEARLRLHPALRDAIVVAREDNVGERRLVAYIVPRNGASPSVSELATFARAALPEYMTPAYFVTLDALPLTHSGKVNYRALPAPGQERPDLGAAYAPPRNALEAMLVEQLQQLLGVERVGIHDNFFELGGDSLKAAIFANRLQTALGEIVYVVVLFDAPTVAELAAYLSEQFPAAVAGRFGLSAASGPRGAAPAVDAPMLAELRAQIAARGPDAESERHYLDHIASRNPRAVFILSAPRSGSTLLRVMLAGNPTLFAPPELALLNYRTLSERKNALAGRDAGWQEGAWRALMELGSLDFEAARAQMERFEQQGWSVQQFYAYLQNSVAPRLLVDKTTTYATHPAFLRRAEALFADAVFVHLVRHPAAMIQSYLRSNLDQVFGHAYALPPRAKAELFWLITNQNVLDFFAEANIPAHRRLTLRYEELATQPEQAMRRLCETLGVAFHPAMLDPYGDEKTRMVDAVHPDSRMVGDPRFLEHKARGIDAALASKDLTLPAEDALSELTLSLAGALGYDVQPSGKPTRAYALSRPQPTPRDGPIPLSYSQQRLWFLDQLMPGQSLYHIPLALRLQGELDSAALENALSEIIRRHEVLRTTFAVDENGEPHQIITPDLRSPFHIIDLQHVPAQARNAEAQRLATEDIARPFDLARGPLLRGLLIRLDPHDHAAVITFHHTIADGWSTGVLVRELSILYRAFASGAPNPLPPLPIQYADYAAWQRQWLQGEVLESQLAYWERKLAGAPPLLELPTDRPRPPVQTFRGRHQTFALSKAATAALKTLARENGATLFMALMAAVQALMARYSGQDDISLGTPIANRTRPELEPLIGFFVNTLVIRTDLSGDPSFRELLRRVRDTSREAYEHQDAPFEQVVNRVQVERNMSFSPLFQVMVSLQNLPAESLDLHGVRLTGFDFESDIATSDMIWAMHEQVDGIGGALNFNADLFDDATIARMLQHFVRLIEAALLAPDAPIADIDLLTPDERARLQAWNDTAAPAPRDETIGQRLAVQAGRTPQAEAIAFRNRSITFAELNARADQIAHALRREGVGPGVWVGLSLERSVEMLVALFGILKAGGAYVPLDPSYPPERIAYMLEDSGAKIVITAEGVEMRGQRSEIRDLIGIRNSEPGTPVPPPASHLPQPSPDDPAYVIYTSGSTGKPKGAVISHRSALNLAAGLQRAIYAHLPQRPLRISLNAPLAFDASVQQWIMLTQGHTLDILPDDIRGDGEALLAYIRERRIELVDCVPTQLRLLLDAGLLSDGGWAPLAMLPGGEAIEPEVWQTLQSAPATAFFNMYGPTECTVDSTIAWVNQSGPTPTIGRPINNVQAYILDRRFRPQPLGVPGELFIGGAGVASGYLHRPELTAERFVPNPFGPGRLYRSGDRARFLPNGDIEFLGRVDDQVKVRGFRIELGEIESVLGQHPAVAQTAVLALPDASGAKRLVAYVAIRAGFATGVSELRAFLSERLPSYMTPSLFVTLDALPLTPNGKINRRALPTPDADSVSTSADYLAPSTTTEETLAEIWAQVLRRERVGIDDNFFELGGDSILSIQVIARARRAGLHITPRQIFQYPTIARLAAVASTESAVQAEQGPVVGSAPLTPIQRWFFEQQFAEPQHWNQALLLQTQQRLERERLAGAVATLVGHHDALRLRFEPDDAGWRQSFAAPTDDTPLDWHDLGAVADPTAEIERIAADAQASLDLTHGPLLRVHYFDLGPDRPGRLLIVGHHLAIDGVSWRVLLDDLLMAYQGAPLPPKTTSFRAWAERLQTLAASDALQAELDHWRNLERADATLPLDLRSGDNDEASGERAVGELTIAETTALLQDAPQAYRTEINDLLLAALAQTIAAWTGRADVLVELEGHGREDVFGDVDLSRTVGWFTSQYPLRLDLRGLHQPSEIIPAVKEQLRAVPQRGLGFGLLRYLSPRAEVRERMIALPSPAISFNYLGQFDQALPEGAPLGPAPENTGPSRSPRAQRTHLLIVTGGVLGGKLRVEWSFSRNRHHRATIAALAENYVANLRALIEHCLDPQAGAVTPSDFRLAKLDQRKLDKVLRKIK